MIDVKKRKITLSPEGELDHHAAKAIREAADDAIRRTRPSVIVIDFSAVSFMDSSGIGLILGRKNLADEIGAEIELTGLSPRLLRMIELSGVLRLSGVRLGKEG